MSNNDTVIDIPSLFDKEGWRQAVLKELNEQGRLRFSMDDFILRNRIPANFNPSEDWLLLGHPSLFRYRNLFLGHYQTNYLSIRYCHDIEKHGQDYDGDFPQPIDFLVVKMNPSLEYELGLLEAAFDDSVVEEGTLKSRMRHAKSKKPLNYEKQLHIADDFFEMDGTETISKEEWLGERPRAFALNDIKTIKIYANQLIDRLKVITKDGKVYCFGSKYKEHHKEFVIDMEHSSPLIITWGNIIGLSGVVKVIRKIESNGQVCELNRKKDPKSTVPDNDTTTFYRGLPSNKSQNVMIKIDPVKLHSYHINAISIVKEPIMSTNHVWRTLSTILKFVPALLVLATSCVALVSSTETYHIDKKVPTVLALATAISVLFNLTVSLFNDNYFNK
ncbi:IMP-specific 5'-nucleotidase [Acrasis kona]|uniref:IMP-specific 5'-nucleotidase n=1 Tax=Acrasis kona TaxID=1008807 RepID=A0AAW2YWI0_9EUKA